MGIPAIQTARLSAYILKQRLLGVKRYPLVLMLEPLFACNLHCKGCGKISYPKDVMAKRLSVAECLDAARECGAPVVSIPGGEPLLHPDIVAIVNGLVADKRFVYLCTNAQLLERRLGDFTPSAYLNVSVHLDGLAPTHDAIVCHPGAFDTAVAGIRLALSRGFRVTTNTTLYRGQSPEEAARFFDFLMDLGVEGMTVSAAFKYDSAADQGSFMTRQESVALFGNILTLGKSRKGKARWRFNHSPLYMEFLAGKRQYQCTPWGSPARNVLGWQRPCYLLDAGYAATFKELMDQTPWEKFGVGNDPRCTNCMVHCGFEPSAVVDAAAHPLKVLAASLRQ